jgi:hypothetical protein
MERFESISISPTAMARRRPLLGLCQSAAIALLYLGVCLGGCLGLVAASSAQASDENQQGKAIAEVASVQGQAEAVGANGQVRSLEIGSPIYAGDSVRTGAGATVGIWHDEALSQIAESSKAKVDHNAAGQTRVTLEEGAVRVVDPRTQGDPIELVALDSSSTVLGGDREARILKEKAGAYSMICDWVKPVSVVRRAEGKGAKPGDCVIANRREPMFAAPGHDQRIPLLGGAPALADAGPAIDPSKIINPLPPVGAGGPPGAIGLPLGPGNGPPGLPLALRSACTTIGAGCQGGFGIVEPPPGDDPFPGGAPVPLGKR